MENIGHIISVKGDVVEVESKGKKLARHDLLTLPDDPEVRLEVYSTNTSDSIMCISLTDPNRLIRGLRVDKLGDSLQVPIGDGLLGRV
ncbi:hypothetical protein LCGC14_1028000, partial [marine sediment metagenome]